MPLRRFPDMQRIIADVLVDAGLLAEGRTGALTPDNLQDVLPYARVTRIGGGSDLLNDSATVDVDLFASSYADGELLAERIRQLLVGPPPPHAGLDRAECVSGPRELPWDDRAAVRRFGASYLVVARRSVVVP